MEGMTRAPEPSRYASGASSRMTAQPRRYASSPQASWKRWPGTAAALMKSSLR